MKTVSAAGCSDLFRRGTVTSRILTFTLSQFGIDDLSFRSTFGQAALRSPFDPYDPALAAEQSVRDADPELYETHEPAWLRCWSRLHEEAGTEASATMGPDFWRERLDGQSLESALAEMRPYRQRCCRRYAVAPVSGSAVQWRIRDIGTPVFSQHVSDRRARARIFAPPPANLIENEALLHLIAMICEIASHVPGGARKTYEVTMHLMLTHAGVSGGKPAPEGMHQDGSDFIVSAVVLERRNVEGGGSVISLYRKNGPPAVDSLVLAEGEGIFQADEGSSLWHGVTGVKPIDSAKPAYRSILGLDICYSGEAR